MPNANLDPYDCDCGWLDRAADDPSMPLGFDAETNEYYIEMKGHVQGRALIRFCPSCGGDAPVSKRDDLFHVVAAEDQMRVHEFATELRTKADVLNKWGTPDEEVRSGYGMPDTESRRTVLLDILRYSNIVPTAIVEVIVRPDERVNIS